MTAALVPPALILHIGAGAVGILSGAAALTARKGERLHRRFGNVFFVSMLTMSAMAIYLAATIPGQSGNLFGGAFTFYLVATAWATVRRKAGSIGRFEIGAFLVALGAAGATIVFIVAATRNPSLQATGSPLGAVYVFAAVASLAAAMDLKVIRHGGISGAQRIARHVWRMCVALFVGTGSFFLGQQKVMPAFIHGSPILVVLAFAPLVLMVFWMVRVRFARAFGNAATAS
jgi:uncharacterized membrane protein